MIAGLDMGISASMCGQNFWKGFAAGCIGGAAGAAVTAILGGNYGATVIGRGAGTAAGDLLNAWFQNGIPSWDDVGLAIADAFMDIGFELYWAAVIPETPKKIVSSAINGFVDGFVDVAETGLFFTPKAQEDIRNFSVSIPSGGSNNVGVPSGGSNALYPVIPKRPNRGGGGRGRTAFCLN